MVRKRGFLLLLLACLAASSVAAPAAAATVTVTSTGDGPANASNCPSPSNCRLRDAIAKAVAGDTITFAPAVTGTITLTDGQLTVGKALTITGPGSSTLTLDAGGNSRIFNITTGVPSAVYDVAISGLTITNGGGVDRGGAIGVFNRGTLTLTDCVVSRSTATSVTGAAFGGGIYSGGGALVLLDSVISDNEAATEISSARGGGMYVADAGVSLTRTTVAQNRAAGKGLAAGGGIYAETSGSPLSLTTSIVRDNEAVLVKQPDGTDAVAMGGGIYTTQSDVRITLTDVRTNQAFSNGQATNSYARGAGIALEQVFDVAIVQSTFASNTATFSASSGGTCYSQGGAVYLRQGVVRIEQSTLNDNLAEVKGAIRQTAQGGAIYQDAGTVTLTNATLSGNTTRTDANIAQGFADNFGSAIYNNSLPTNVDHVLTVQASTVVDNRVDAIDTILGMHTTGSAIHNLSATPVTLQNTIVARNTTTHAGQPASATDVEGDFASNGFNFIGSGTGSTGFINGVTGDQVGTSASPLDPLLDALAPNGGATQTHLPASNSPVIDKGRAFGLTVDQRGAVRPFDNLVFVDADDGSDIGAVEVGGQIPTNTTITSSVNPSFTGAPVTLTASVRETPSNVPVTAGTVTFFEGVTALSAALPLNASGQAAFTTSTLTEGSHIIRAEYSGTVDFLAANGSLTQVVNNQTVITGNDYCNPGRVTIPRGLSGSPYPSNIFVSGFAGAINSLSVKLNKVNSTRQLGDFDLLLVGPGGQTYEFLSEASTAIAFNVNLVMADSGGTFVVSGGQVLAGTYAPIDGVPVDTYVPPAPAGPYQSAQPSGTATFFSVFGGLSGASVNGTWRLFSQSNSAGAPDITIDSWCLTIVPSAVPVTVTTAPAGLGITVDSTPYTSPQTFNWVPGSAHTIATTTPQAGTPGTQYVFTAWQDDALAPISRSVTVGGATTYAANFKVQHQLTTTASAGGTIAPASGFYDAGNVIVTATADPGFTFAGFSGALSGTTNPQTLNLTAPASVLASFQALNPSMTLTKTSTAPGFAAAGDVLPFTMVAKNTGDVPLVNVAITNPLVPTITCTSVGGTPATGQPVSLPPGATVTCKGNYTVTPADVVAGFVTNTATATGAYDDGFAVLNPFVARAEALVTVTAQGTVTVLGVAPGIADPRIAFQTCSGDLQQDWIPTYTKLQFEVWNEDEVKFTGAYECADSWHDTDLATNFDAAPQNFTVAVLGTFAARYRVQAVASTQCAGSQATGLLGVQSMAVGATKKMAGTTLTGAGKAAGTIRWDPADAVPEGADPSKR